MPEAPGTAPLGALASAPPSPSAKRRARAYTRSKLSIPGTGRHSYGRKIVVRDRRRALDKTSTRTHDRWSPVAPRTRRLPGEACVTGTWTAIEDEALIEWSTKRCTVTDKTKDRDPKSAYAPASAKIPAGESGARKAKRRGRSRRPAISAVDLRRRRKFGPMTYRIPRSIIGCRSNNRERRLPMTGGLL
jgi:hypothetical protein